MPFTRTLSPGIVTQSLAPQHHSLAPFLNRPLEIQLSCPLAGKSVTERRRDIQPGFVRILQDRTKSETVVDIPALDCVIIGNWKEYFKSDLIKIGQLIKHHNIRISMHPDQFVILNAKSQDIVNNSIRELEYHTDLLDLMELDYSSKVQIHIGGVYGDKEKSKKQFISNYKTLISENIKKRLVIENDDHLYSLKDCIEIHEYTGIPVLFDVLHHLCFDNILPLDIALQTSNNTWNRSKDGIMMIDYSDQELNQRKGKHSHTLNIKQFEKFIIYVSNMDLDIMLEIKDKEKSAKKAIEVINKINRI